MPLLLDTNVFIRMFADPGTLPEPVRQALLANDVFMSIATPWEMVIKESLGKLRLSKPALHIVAEHLRRRDVALLEIRLEHLEQLRALPHHHRDPFYRIIIAQALSERVARSEQ
jgi:PIN domain nuclease of toxin-antitoxin system